MNMSVDVMSAVLHKALLGFFTDLMTKATTVSLLPITSQVGIPSNISFKEQSKKRAIDEPVKKILAALYTTLTRPSLLFVIKLHSSTMQHNRWLVFLLPGQARHRAYWLSLSSWDITDIKKKNEKREIHLQYRHQ
jgi:hypothetical protein